MLDENDGLDDRSPSFNSFHYHNVELRSDMKTLPNHKMREAVLNVEVGDMDNLTDPTVQKLEDYVKKLFGKEYGLMVTTGAMANLIITLMYANPNNSKKDEYILVGDVSYYMIVEVATVFISGLNYIPIKTLQNGLFDFTNEAELEKILVDYYTKNKVSLSFEEFLAKIKLLFVENTHNFSGGKMHPVDYGNTLKTICSNLGKKYPQFNVKMGVDSSRILHAAVEQKVDPSVLVKDYDICHISCTKSIGGPIGNVMCFNNEADYKRARYLRKGCGGFMRQGGVAAIMILVGLENIYEKIRHDHKNAKLLASGVSKIKGVKVDDVHTNIVRFFLEGNLKGKEDLIIKTLAEKYKVHMAKWWMDDYFIRAVFHYQVSTKQTEYAVKCFEKVIEEVRPMDKSKF